MRETFSRAQNVGVAESANEGDSREVVEIGRRVSVQEPVLQTDVPHLEAGVDERSGHLSVAVTSLLSDDGHARTTA